jgi:hypothetical protein
MSIGIGVGLNFQNPLAVNNGPVDVTSATLLARWISTLGVLNPSDASAANGENVKTWQDQAGSARHLQQPTSGNRPNYNTGSSIFSVPVIDFDEVNADFLVTADGLLADTAPYTIGLVWAPKVGINNACIVLNTDHDGVGTFFLEDTGTDTFFLNAGASALGSAYTPGTKYFTLLEINSASSKHYKNGVLIGTGNPGNRPLAGLSLGAYVTSGDPSHMQVAEMWVHNGILSDADKTLLSNYALPRYGIT